MSAPATKRTWSLRRKAKAIDAGKGHPRIEYVPGTESGLRGYFWIGSNRTFFGSIDARALAAFVDSVAPVLPTEETP
jgi:hypothetical protein